MLGKDCKERIGGKDGKQNWRKEEEQRMKGKYNRREWEERMHGNESICNINRDGSMIDGLVL